MVLRPPARGTVLVVQRDWPQQENPALPLLPAGAPAVLSGRVATAATVLPADPLELAGQVLRLAADRGLAPPPLEVLVDVGAHALRAAGDVAGELRLVVADVGPTVLAYALVTPAVGPGAPAVKDLAPAPPPT